MTSLLQSSSGVRILTLAEFVATVATSTAMSAPENAEDVDG